MKKQREELEEYWNDQLDYLKRSIDYFDQGHETEARRIANSLMLLIVKNYKQHLIVFTNQTNFSTVCLQMLICIQIVLALETKNKVQQSPKCFVFWKMLTLSMPKGMFLEMLMNI